MISNCCVDDGAAVKETSRRTIGRSTEESMKNKSIERETRQTLMRISKEKR